jgi:hypothetical protein
MLTEPALLLALTCTIAFAQTTMPDGPSENGKEQDRRPGCQLDQFERRHAGMNSSIAGSAEMNKGRSMPSSKDASTL